MACERRYPVGMQSFTQIRQNGYVYVDKTAYIHAMTSRGGNFYFLSRPRRFGKSLLVATLEAYFQARRELFHGLAIDSLQPEEWQSHPVLRLDLSRFKVVDRPGLMSQFDVLFEPLEKQWGVSKPAPLPGARLEGLVRAAYVQTGKEVVVLVDEYDAPLLTVLHRPERLQELREVMRDLYAPLKALSEMLRFVFITGVSRFSQLSIFSELNNLQNISMLPQYAGICGITQQELEEDLGQDVEQLAERLGLTTSEGFAALKDLYDGYHFAAPSPDIYNPFSLFTALDVGRLADYWFSSGTPTMLVDLIPTCGYGLEQLDAGDVRARASSFDAPTQGNPRAVPLLYQSGYLTIKGYNPVFDSYRLGIPNREVRRGLFEALLPSYSGLTPDRGDALVEDLACAVMAGDLDRFFRLLRSFFAGMDRHVAIKDEQAFEQALYLVMTLVGASVRCEVSTAQGRADMILETDDTVCALELKFSRPDDPATAAQAVAQVLERGYLTPFEAGGRSLVAAGAVFSQKEGTITEWLVQEAGPR